MQFYQDKNVYPNSQKDWVWDGTSVETFVQVLPGDSKNGQGCLGSGSTTTVCAYLYTVWADKNTIANWAYKLSIWFEDAWNHDKLAAADYDNWSDVDRYELWSWKNDLWVWKTSNFTETSSNLIKDSTDTNSIWSDGIVIARWGIIVTH
jgi:hypothetical protein